MLAVKPWNDPWTRAAMRDPQYKVYCCSGYRGAANMSWRRIKKALSKGPAQLGRRETALYERIYGRQA
jgi:hypothetical protein